MVQPSDQRGAGRAVRLHARDVWSIDTRAFRYLVNFIEEDNTVLFYRNEWPVFLSLLR